MTIKRHIEVDIDLTPSELAAAFWELGSIDQGEFFNSLGIIAGSDIAMQMQHVKDDDVLTNEGRYAMSVIGNYS